jgi:tetratricopeptide (TPR) repeat protein
LRYQGDAASYGGNLKAARTLYEQSLQPAVRARDSEKILLAKLALAHNDVQQGRSAATIAALRTLGQQVETMGLKYEAVQASLDLAEALISTRALPQARTELERAVTRCDKLGLRFLGARGEYLLATDLRLGGDNKRAAEHYRNAQGLLGEIHQDAASDDVLHRADVAAISADTKRWLSSSQK